MEFTVKTRTAGGSFDYEVVEADSRAAVFQILKKRGISAVSVSEGANAPKRPAASGNGKPSPVRGIVAGLVVVALAVVAYFALSPSEKPSTPERPERPKAEKPKPAKPTADKGERPVRPQVSTTTAPATNAPAAKKVDPNERLDLVATTNKSGEVMERWRTPDGKTHARLIPPPPIFDNVIDQTLSIALSVPTGHTLPPMPSLGPNSDKQFAEALKKPIKIKDDDPENVKKAKLLVQAGREAILDALASGKSVQEILADHCATVNDNAELRNQVAKEYRKLVADGDMEMAEQYRESANKVLEKSGAEPVPQHSSTPRRQRKETEK